ncbi:MAG: sigma-E processing peptidase SpoIIGA [Firmicutes bacterium]|nr:sigma-E processing peptidase SpoIIGA [Bacillota bacterium]
MAIYGEYLFLENFAAGIIILFFTGKILGATIRPVPMMISGICCGAYAFVIFVPLGGLLSWICKGAFSSLMVWAAFRPDNRKKLLYGTMVFLGVTFFYGGIAIAFLTSFSRTGVTAAAGVYLSPLTYVSVTAAATGAALFLWFLLNILKTRRMDGRRIIETELILGTARWKLQGFIDTGNDLTDPLTGGPVCIVDRMLGQRMMKEAGGTDLAETRYRAIPYRAVGTEQGILDGFRMDAISFPDGFTVKNPVIAFCEEGHFRGKQGESENQILLPASLLERGIYGDL